MVSAGWWLGTPPQQRQNLVAGRMLALPDGTWWLFGAWGRWYRWTPADGQWHLCPPPQLTITRMSARPLQQGVPVPQVPPHVVPAGPDLAYEPPPALAFVDAGVRPEMTSRVRATVEAAAALPTPDYPHWWGLFSSAVPSTVPVTWGVMLWCATAPVFDARIDAQMLGLWSSYRSRPLPEVDGPRWLTPPPLESLVGLYAERLRSGRVDSAVVILRTMWAMASALREDSRFQPRADALITMLGATLQNPTIDYGALAYGDQAVVQQWLTRCPPALAPALRLEASAGEHFRNAYYDLTVALTPVAGGPAERGYVEPRLIAAALLAADLAVVRKDVSGQAIGWLDPQVGEAMRAMLIQRDHPLRPFWPEGDRLPRPLRERMDAAGPTVRNTLLATMYAADLAWCRLGGGIPARPRGFPASVAILAEIIGPRRATSAAPTEAVSQAPGIAPLAHQYPANPSIPDRTPGVPMAQRPPAGPPGQAPAWAPPAAPSHSPATQAWAGAQPWPNPAEQEPATPSPSPSPAAWAGSGERPVGQPDFPPVNGPGAGSGEHPAAPPATAAWPGAQPMPGGGTPSPPADAPSGERGLGSPAAPPPTEAWGGSGERPMGGAAAPPATAAWSGAEGLDVRPSSPAEGRSGSGEPEANQAGEVVPPTPAWPGTAGTETGRGARPPATRAWSTTGERGAGTPPPSSAWPGTADDNAVTPPPGTGPGAGTEGADRSGRPPATQAWPGTGEGAAVAPPGTVAQPGSDGSAGAASPSGTGEGDSPAVRPEPGGSGGADEARPTPSASRVGSDAEAHHEADAAASSPTSREPSDVSALDASAPDSRSGPGPEGTPATTQSPPPDSLIRLAAEGSPTGTADGLRGPGAGRSPTGTAGGLGGPGAEEAPSGAGAPVSGAQGQPGDVDRDTGGAPFVASGVEDGAAGSAGHAATAGSGAEAAPMPPSAAPAGSDEPGHSGDMPADGTGGDTGGDRTSADSGAGFTVIDPSALREAVVDEGRTGQGGLRDDGAVGEGSTGQGAGGLPGDGDDDLTAPDVGGADTSADEEGDETRPDEGAGALGNVTMMDSFDEHVTGPTMLDPIEEQKNATYVDWIGGTRADAGSIPIVAPAPVTPGPPRTRMIEEQAPPPPPEERQGTRVMSGTMVGDLLRDAPMPERPVDQIAPPPAPVSMPKVTERFGVRFLSERDDATELFDELQRTASRSGNPPALLIVGEPHAGQRRLTRLVARTFAGAGVGDGSVRTADGADLRGDRVTAVTAILRDSGPPLLFERLDRAVLDASDPGRVVAAVMSARENNAPLIATCEPGEYARLRERFPELTGAFQVFRLPDLAGVQARLALLHVLADERRVTITASGLDVVRGDLTRLGGHGDLVGARLVEAYLERAVVRHVERAGAPRDRMVLVPVDFAGVAEEIEPALRPPRDVDGYLRGLQEMIGLDEVKRTVGGLVTEARMAADRAARGLPSGNPSRHLIFLGRPGTGKATVAGLIGGIYAALNLLDTGQLVVCGAKDLTGSETAAYVDRATGGVLLIEDASLLDRMPVAVDELARLMAERRDKFMVICAGLPDEMEGFLLAHRGFRAEFGAIIEFREPTERQLVQLFSRLAERDLYMLDEELRVELLDRFAGMRRYPVFAFADTVRRLFDQIVARQAARLGGAQVDPAAVARLSVRDLPESQAGELLEELRPPRRRSPE